MNYALAIYLMSLALYRKWRPRRWEAVIGQPHIVQTLRNAVATERVAHAYLFAGPRGTGKTTTARILAKAVNCLHADPAARPCDECEHCRAVQEGRFLDLIEIDAASNTSVDDVRDLREKINFSPNQGQYKVYIVDEVHMLSTAAFNALLKTLEEPPPHAIFVLATTEVHKIPATVLSRCQRHEFRRIPLTDIVARLKEMAAAERFDVSPEALTLIARQASGAMRDAESLLDQLASTGQAITLDLVQAISGTATSQATLEVIDALVADEAAGGLVHLHHTLDGGSDPRQFARQIVNYLRDVLLVRMGNAAQVDATVEVRAKMAQHAQAFSTPELLEGIRAFNRAAVDTRSTWQSALPLEMAFVECLARRNVTTPAPREETSSSPLPVSPAPAPAESQERQRTAARPTTSPPRARLQPSIPPPVPEDAPLSPPSVETDPADAQAAQILEANWERLLSLVRAEAPNTYGLLNSCKSRHISSNALTLGFASDVLKNQMSKKENADVVQKAVEQIIGKKVTIRCILTTAQRTTLPVGVDHNGMVAAAVRDLGGEIVTVQ